MASIVLKNKSLFIPGRGGGGKIFGLRSDHMGGRGFWDFGGITWGGGWGYRKFIANEIPFRGGVIRYYVLHSLRGGGSSKLYHNTNKILPPPPLPPGST